MTNAKTAQMSDADGALFLVYYEEAMLGGAKLMKGKGLVVGGFAVGAGVLLVILAALAAPLLVRLGVEATPVATGAPAASRAVSSLQFDSLMNGFNFDGPVDEAALTPPENAAPPVHVFEGRLELLGEKDGGRIQVLRGELEPEFAFLPEFDFEFVQSDGYLIPTRRGLIVTDHPQWNIHLEPGRAWQEAGDGAFSRASLPFALSVKGGNATFNGTLTFLFDDQRVSKVWYQVTQETTSYTQANLWGLLEATYHPSAVVGAEQIRADFAAELAARLPVKPIQALAQDYPGVDVSAFGRGVTPEHMTWYGVVANGVNYLGGCQTRFGVYPYCESMRASSYSTAKSAFPSVALMRLAQKYGPEVASLLVKTYVPEYTASPGDWERVTFNHAIDMSSGNYVSSGYMVDDNSEKMGEFFAAQPYAERIKAAFDCPHAADPGTRWVYRTSDTFILTRALHNYLQTQEGPQADIFRFVVDEVYRPLGLGPGAYTTMRTADDDWQGQAEGGYGLWWIPDDIAKISTLLNDDGGAIGGVQVLQPDLLAAAMQHDPDDRGVRIDARRMYNNAFWANRYTRADGFDCEFWVPQMLGVSGNVVALMPNGVTYYYFSDNQEFTWDAALREADKIIPFCRSSPSTLTPAFTDTPHPPRTEDMASRASLLPLSGDTADRVERLYTLSGHSGRVMDLTFSGDGAYIASSSLDQTIRLWNVVNQQEAYAFSLSKVGFNGIAFSPDGRLLASADVIWDVESRQLVHTLEQGRQVPGPVAFSPNGSLLAVALESQPIKLWDVASGRVARTFEDQADDVTFRIVFSPDGALLAAGVHGGMVRLWDVKRGEIAGTLEHGQESDDVHDVAFSPDGEVLASVANDGTIRLWDLASGQAVHTLQQGNGLYGVAFSPNGSLLASAGCDRTVKLWDVASGQLLRSLSHSDEVMAVAFAPDGTLLVSGGYDSQIYLWGVRP